MRIMGAPRPHEALNVLRALEDLASADPLNVRGVLATLLTLDGAPHERSGGAGAVLRRRGRRAPGQRALGDLARGAARRGREGAVRRRRPRSPSSSSTRTSRCSGPEGCPAARSCGSSR